MSKLLFANWKMNPLIEREAVRLAKAGDNANAVILAPFLFLSAVQRTLKEAAVGVQNVSWAAQGPLTGEVSAKMVKGMGAAYAVIGHSERRGYLGETDAIIAEKMKAALEAGLTPILCVGEPKDVRKKGFAAAKVYVKKQLSADLSKIKNSKFKNFIIAYEPIWAISTSGGGKETPEDAAEMARFIRGLLVTKLKIKNSKVLYGGSVNAKNVGDFLAMPEIDGALVGGASLNSAEFRKMMKVAENL